MTKIPKTNVDAVFQTVHGKYPHLYYDHGENGPAVASMNAGNSGGLWVGGDGINAGFQRALAGQDTSEYGQRHIALFDEAKDTGPMLKVYGDDNPCKASFVVPSKLQGVTDYTGVCFVDVFADALCPKGNGANRAMLYLAPPQDSHYAPSVPNFLKAISEVGEHAASAVAGYNQAAPGAGLPVLPAIRLCMYSSGIYNDTLHAPLDQIALAIFEGISRGLAKACDGVTEVQMPVKDSTHDPYFHAVQAKLTG